MKKLFLHSFFAIHKLNIINQKYIGISKTEIKADLEGIFGKDNKQIIEALYWVLNDAVCCFEPKGWDE